MEGRVPGGREISSGIDRFASARGHDGARRIGTDTKETDTRERGSPAAAKFSEECYAGELREERPGYRTGRVTVMERNCRVTVIGIGSDRVCAFATAERAPRATPGPGDTKQLRIFR